jgi:hypothetical protein
MSPVLPPPPRTPDSPPPGTQRLAGRWSRAYHAYGTWLAGISWKKFALLSLALLMVTNVLEDLPPFKWSRVETVVFENTRPTRSANAPATPATPATPSTPSTPTAPAATDGPTPPAATAAPLAAPAPPTDAALERALRDARHALSKATADKRGISIGVTDEDDEASPGSPERRVRRITMNTGDGLSNLAFLWIVLSGVLKGTYKGRLQAEAQAAQASLTADAETLKRQVVEARMAAMQAQVEPHFLFNTLASIDHLIQTDPSRASAMQKSLIALLRASMPNLRQHNGSGVRTLGEELAVIEPYLAILKVRMEDRLQATVTVPEGLRSAAFPPLMLQGLVENAIKHGLEPKAEGGSLAVRADVVDGKLEVSVADTGLGFGAARTSGTGVGLQNIRERLKLLHGDAAALTITAAQPSGCKASISVPYRSLSSNSTSPQPST